MAIIIAVLLIIKLNFNCFTVRENCFKKTYPCNNLPAPIKSPQDKIWRFFEVMKIIYYLMINW